MYALSNFRKFVEDNAARLGDKAEGILERAVQVSNGEVIPATHVKEIMGDDDLERDFCVVVLTPEHLEIGMSALRASGENRNIDEDLLPQAPAGKFRIIGVDTFDYQTWLVGDCDTLLEAQELAEKKVGDMTVMHIFNDHGRRVWFTGTP
ncbi:hypothetical protein COU01_00840 [Candidatus Falkowbacteria bacterium CG10_big_fil_rev_8_21_14_0_10_44_15]|uniref:Uncharacterized protein n=1 Tax=Candidatus Falkowbacteria bacterium CG10_big_fil_rev_8_21_14_0_10_44_15 TaxID=1974569 RepID=A0A2H0V0L0_9BACT|nr:MAG: hypothetical protein COU01_00840 [Candidatus Falkowbacteria bacterium CG10_big_fil_rev_8_21_14_0_10_44_15]